VRRHTLVNGLSEAGAGARTGCRTNNLCWGYGPHLIHRTPIIRTYKALRLSLVVRRPVLRYTPLRLGEARR
jgi:hypothetical protein